MSYFFRKLARALFCTSHGARHAARLGVRNYGLLGQACDGARGVWAKHTRLWSTAQHASTAARQRRVRGIRKVGGKKEFCSVSSMSLPTHMVLQSPFHLPPEKFHATPAVSHRSLMRSTSAQRWGFGANRKSVAGSLEKQQLLSTAEWHCHNTTTGWVIVASRRRGASLRALHQGSYSLTWENELACPCCTNWLAYRSSWC